MDRQPRACYVPGMPDNSSNESRGGASFRAMLRHDGKMVAGLAVVPGRGARFFVLARRETEDAFVGRVAGWIKTQGAAGLRMESPDMIPEGTSVPEFLLRLRANLAVDGTDPDADEFDVKGENVLDGEPN